jgi:hypothetical protein
MPPAATQPAGPSRFAPLAAALATREEETLTVSFAAIEALIGKPLSISAQVSPSYRTSRSSRLGRELHAIGWRAQLRMQECAVLFERRDRTAPER